jgi:hypothetical protein
MGLIRSRPLDRCGSHLLVPLAAPKRRCFRQSGTLQVHGAI